MQDVEKGHACRAMLSCPRFPMTCRLGCLRSLIWLLVWLPQIFRWCSRQNSQAFLRLSRLGSKSRERSNRHGTASMQGFIQCLGSKSASSYSCHHTDALPCRRVLGGRRGLPLQCKSCLSDRRCTAPAGGSRWMPRLATPMYNSAHRHTRALLCRWFQVGGEAPRQKPLPHGERRASTACPSRHSKSRARRASDCSSSADSMDEQATGQLDVTRDPMHMLGSAGIFVQRQHDVALGSDSQPAGHR